MNTLDVKLKLNNLHCFDEGDGIGSAEPYLWTVFFKIDGDTTLVNSALNLQGSATVIGTPGNHGDLPNHDVDAGENVAIPAALGETVGWWAGFGAAGASWASSAFDFTAVDRMSSDPNCGAMVVPSELKAWDSVRRAEAVSGLPSTATNGLAATCRSVMPDASTNSASRNSAYERAPAAGSNSRQPAAAPPRPMMIPFL